MLGYRIMVLMLIAVFALSACEKAPPINVPSLPPVYDVIDKSIAQLQNDLNANNTTSVEITRLYLARIYALDKNGPRYNAVISVNPEAVNTAIALDKERKQGKIRSPLHGIPLLLKDNINTFDPIPTTGGSLALKNNFAVKDSHIAKRLRDAGAIILGKTNLSEWANFRSSYSTSGWSAINGFTQYPFDPTRNPCGSSSGSATAVAMSFAAAAIGTETDGSIVCPSSLHSLVGIKPTVGLVSRTGIIPISESQDTAGPMTRTVEDAILILSSIAGTDSTDPATKQADVFKADYRSSLRTGALDLTKLGVVRFTSSKHPKAIKLFEETLITLQDAGATLVELVEHPNLEEIGAAEYTVLLTEFHSGLNVYLGETDPLKVPTRSLQALIAFNNTSPEELAYFGQDIFEQALLAPSMSSTEYTEARVKAKKQAGPEGIDKLLRKHRLDALIAITTGPSWKSDTVNGDHYTGGFSTLAAVAGYPHITVPLGEIDGLPIGLSFVGSAWSEGPLLALAYAFEQLHPVRSKPATQIIPLPVNDKSTP